MLPSFHRSRALIAGLGIATIAAATGLPLASATPATPATPSAPAALTASGPFSASADTSLLTVDIPALSPAILPQTNVDVTHSVAAADSAGTPRTSGTAGTTGTSALLGAPLAVQETSATAPPSSTDSATLLPLDLSPLANLPVINTEAAANWISDTECIAATDPLSLARQFVADADVVAPDPGVSVLAIDPAPGEQAVDFEVSTGLPSIPGANDPRAVEAIVSPEVADVSLLNNLAPGLAALLTVEVVNDAGYVVRATGLPGGATVTGNDPVLNVTLAGNQVANLVAGGTPVDSTLTELTLGDLFTGQLLTDLVTDVFAALNIPLPVTPLTDAVGIAVVQLLDALQPVVRLSIPVSKVTSADGTTASVDAALLSVQVLAPTLTASPLDPVATALNTILGAIGAAPGQPLASVVLGPMHAEAHAPLGGITCGNPDDSNPLELQKLNSGPAIPGSSFDYTIAVGNVGDCAMSPVRVVDTLVGPAGSSVALTEPSGAVVTDQGGGTFRIEWADVGPLAPDGRTSLRIRVNVPLNAQIGDRYTDTVTSTASIVGGPNCTPRDVTRTVVLNEPAVERAPSGTCNITGSTKAKSHLEVYPGESFIYFVNVLNGGGTDCTNVTVVDPIDSRLTFESCSDGCVFSAPNASWNIGTLRPGQSVTLRLQVKVNQGATGNLANAATIDTDQGGPTVVRVDGPLITTNTVLSPNVPARIPDRDLARTGGDPALPLPVVLGLAIAGLAAWQLRRRAITA